MVPAAVPSEAHSSVPLDNVVALKNTLVPDTVRFDGVELPAPALMSATCTVPAAVPSLFHSSAPLVPLFAVKNAVPFRLTGVALGLGCVEVGATEMAELVIALISSTC